MKIKKVIITCLALFIAIYIVACGSSKEASSGTSKDATVMTVKQNMHSQGEVQKVMIPNEIERIPDRYFDKSNQPGTLKDLYYDTYESFSYNKKSKPLKKHAIVYLPYGYSKDQKYDVFYLMHGGGGDETMTLGTPRSPSSFKNIIDHAVA